MKWTIAIALLALLLLGCQGGSAGSALTADECAQVYDRSSAIAKRHLGIEGVALGGPEQRQLGIDACAAGESFTREDFDCVAKANTMKDVDACNLVRHM